MNNVSERSVECLSIHPLNGRSTRPKEDIERLAERMRRNGFEVTRAPWVTMDGGVFAGGTRLLAARLAGLAIIPVIVFDNLSEDDIVRLADKDNANDEYHRPVPVVDVWAACAALADAGWTQARSAEAKGCDQADVSRRIGWHRSLPVVAREAICNDVLDEGHLTALSSVVCDVPYLQSWLTTAKAQTELVDEVLGKHRGSSVGIKPTVKVVREAAKRWKEVISTAETALAEMAEAHRDLFVAQLVSEEARSVSAVERARAHVQKVIADEKLRAASNANAEAEAERKKSETLEREQSVAQKVIHGDARKHEVPEGTKLLLTDPPYGMAFQHGSRRKISGAKKAIAGDDNIAEALELLEAVASSAFARMADDSHALVFTSWRYEPNFRLTLEHAGFRIQQSLVWVKNNHGIGNTETTFSPRHERIIYAVKGKPKLLKRHEDVLYGTDQQNSRHPTEKPRDLLHSLIEATTEPGDIVADPFAGSGNTILEALAMGRDAWGCEVDDEYHAHISDSLLAFARAAAA